MKYIALIRNPMDTLYSMWKRWYAIPEIRQFEWLRAYKNLSDFVEKNQKYCLFIKYEELVKKPKEIFQKIYKFLGIESELPNMEFHKCSINKWRNDKIFAFNLSPQVYKFSKRWYKNEELKNNGNSILWDFMVTFSIYRFNLMMIKNRIKKFIKDKIKASVNKNKQNGRRKK